MGECYDAFKKAPAPFFNIAAITLTLVALIGYRWVHINDEGSIGLWITCPLEGACQYHDGEPFIKAVQAFLIMGLIFMIPGTVANGLALTAKSDKLSSWAAGLMFGAWMCVMIAMSIFSGCFELPTKRWRYGWAFDLGWCAFVLLCFGVLTTAVSLEASRRDEPSEP